MHAGEKPLSRQVPLHKATAAHSIQKLLLTEGSRAYTTSKIYLEHSKFIADIPTNALCLAEPLEDRAVHPARSVGRHTYGVAQPLQLMNKLLSVAQLCFLIDSHRGGSRLSRLGFLAKCLPSLSANRYQLLDRELLVFLLLQLMSLA